MCNNRHNKIIARIESHPSANNLKRPINKSPFYILIISLHYSLTLLLYSYFLRSLFERNNFRITENY